MFALPKPTRFAASHKPPQNASPPSPPQTRLLFWSRAFQARLFGVLGSRTKTGAPNRFLGSRWFPALLLEGRFWFLGGNHATTSKLFLVSFWFNVFFPLLNHSKILVLVVLAAFLYQTTNSWRLLAGDQRDSPVCILASAAPSWTGSLR